MVICHSFFYEICYLPGKTLLFLKFYSAYLLSCGMFSQSFYYEILLVSAAELKAKALNWAHQFRLVAFYENNQTSYKYNGFQNILAVSNAQLLSFKSADAFQELKAAVQNQNNNILCTLLSYDLKNQVENLNSQHPDYIQFPLIYYFQPEFYLQFYPDHLQIFSPQEVSKTILDQILAAPLPVATSNQTISIQPRISKAAYLQTIAAIKNDILNGEIYEMNYCMEFFAEQVKVEPLPLFLSLNSLSPMPFAGYVKLADKYLLCASPERFIKKTGTKLLSQPIKGTIARGKTPEQDEHNREKLRTDDKEIAENMMIMDLVRNDLSKSCVIGSVQVEEMFGIYGFEQVFQMITTVSGQLRPDCHPVDALKNAFPMGSMTGAPKIRAMQLIEQYEKTRRGLYSGSLGYFLPNGDFDFNVVIRSLQYNATTGYLSFMVGGAITYDSDPEQEYQECLLKAAAILKILQK